MRGQYLVLTPCLCSPSLFSICPYGDQRSYLAVPCIRPHLGSCPMSRTGEKQAWIPVERASFAIARPTRYTRSVSKLADKPRLCGNMDCLKDPTPCKHSAVCISGIFRRDLSRFNCCNSLYCEIFRVYLGRYQHTYAWREGEAYAQPAHQSCMTPMGEPGEKRIVWSSIL